MMLIEDINQIVTLHKYIQQRNTGTPEEFASKLCISRRKLYYLLEVIKRFGGSISYSRVEKTFFYPKGFDINIKILVKMSSNKDWLEVLF